MHMRSIRRKLSNSSVVTALIEDLSSAGKACSKHGDGDVLCPDSEVRVEEYNFETAVCVRITVE